MRRYWLDFQGVWAALRLVLFERFQGRVHIEDTTHGAIETRWTFVCRDGNALHRITVQIIGGPPWQVHVPDEASIEAALHTRLAVAATRRAV